MIRTMAANGSASGIATARRRSSSLNSSISSKVSTASLGEERNGGKKITLVITGGTGWFGSTIAKLAYSHWDSLEAIRLFDSNPPDRDVISDITGFSAPPDHPKVSYHHGSVLDEEALLACFAKADVVIHCAAIVEKGSFLGRRNMKSVNVDGTHNVVQACLECGIRALVFTGTLVQVLGADTAKPVRYDEHYQLNAKEPLIFPHYGGSKTEAENLVLLANGTEGRQGVTLRTCSLRCPIMYGEGDRATVPSAIRIAKRCLGYYIPMGLLSNNGVTVQTLYVGNGAWAHVHAARKLLESSLVSGTEDSSSSLEVSNMGNDIGGKFYYIGDHSPVCSMTNFFSQFLRPLGYRVLPFGVPFCLLRIVVFFLELLLILLSFIRVNVSSGLNRGTLKFLKQSHSVSWDRASKELEYTPLYSHKTALAQSMEFYRKAL